MSTLQDLINATPIGGTLDLKGDTYEVGADPMQQFPLVFGGSKAITVVGSGAIIHVLPSKLRSRPALMVRAPNVNLLGDVTIHADDDKRDAALEAQHGIELQGAVNFTSHWAVENVQGSSHYWGKNPNLTGGTGWCRNVTLQNPVCVNSGRQHVAMQAVDGFKILRPNFTRCPRNHSAFAFEPNGHDWGCKNGYIANGIVRGPCGPMFGSLGLGDHQPSYNLSHIVFDSMAADGFAFGIRVVNGVGQRRGPLAFINCSSDTIANQPCVRCQGVDGLMVLGFKQPVSNNISPFENSPDCTNVFTSLAI